MTAISDLVETASDDAIAVVDDTDYVTDQMESVKKMLNNFANVVYADGISRAGAADNVDSILANLEAEVSPITDTINEMLSVLKVRFSSSSRAFLVGVAVASFFAYPPFLLTNP
jgi:hypothetical protein